MGVLTGMQGSVQPLGVCGRVLRTGRALSYVYMLRASELFAKEKGVCHKVYYLRTGCVVCRFYGITSSWQKVEYAKRTKDI